VIGWEADWQVPGSHSGNAGPQSPAAFFFRWSGSCPNMQSRLIIDAISKANKQIRSTKIFMDRPNAKGLNKGEAAYKLKSAVFFHERGEIHDRSLDSQAFRASGLNLVVSVIVHWNSVYLGRSVEQLRNQGR
jgi:TnpA family transposase